MALSSALARAVRRHTLYIWQRCTPLLTDRGTIHVGRQLSTKTLSSLRVDRAKDIEDLPEVRQTRQMLESLRRAAETEVVPAHQVSQIHGVSRETYLVCIRAALATLLLHTEARTASLLGEGFYTIGPCGEELLAAVGVVLQSNDSVALHYRHVATQISRQLMQNRSLGDILLDRARGFTCSRHDPVTGGVHCAIGGGDYDYVVTSTLASQAPPAVGRALGIGLVNTLGVLESQYKSDSRPISFVSLGDGSVNNAHFLSAANMAEYAVHRRMPCPVLFGISDNRLCISLRNYGWLKTFIDRFKFPVFRTDANDIFAIKQVTAEAAEYCRRHQSPALIVFSNINRRFGHAATDRQQAYMAPEEIQALQDKNVVLGACHKGVQTGLVNYAELSEMAESIWTETKHAFEVAAAEPKHQSRQHLIDRLRPKDPPAKEPFFVHIPWAASSSNESIKQSARGKEVMRKSMNRAVLETLEKYPEAIYLGEDVRHGGYYSVTDKAAERFKSRVQDFPPDETSLIGAALGYAQTGLLPICEIPYAKYLDCGADMFFETVLLHWLTNGHGKSIPGVFFRLQGFGRGVFGGNFHTHNILHLPPGLDVVCYSNGQDYSQGFRHGIEKVKQGHMVMSVDSTHLLNLRHVSAKDNLWMRSIAGTDARSLDYTFDQVNVYGSDPTHADAVVITYGEGVLAGLQAKKTLELQHGINIQILDNPLLSRVPKGLKEFLKTTTTKGIVFADVCKEGQHPFGGMSAKLHSEGHLNGKEWRCIAACPTYNPLGCTVTFLSADDIVSTVLSLDNE